MEFKTLIWLGVLVVGVVILYKKRDVLFGEVYYRNNSPLAGFDARKRQWVLGQGYSGRWEGMTPNNSGGLNLVLDVGGDFVHIPNVSTDDNLRWIGDEGDKASGNAVLVCNRTLSGGLVDWSLFLQPSGVSEVRPVLRRLERDRRNAEYNSLYDRERSLAEKKLLDYGKIFSQIKGEFDPKRVEHRVDSGEIIEEGGNYVEQGGG